MTTLQANADKNNMTLLIAILLIKGFNLSAGWYFLAAVVWVGRLAVHSSDK